MQNQSKYVFLSNTKKNPKDCMAVTLRSSGVLEERRNEKKKIEEEKHTEIGKAIKQNISEITKEERIVKVQQNQPVEEGDLRKKEEIQAYKPQVPFPHRL